MIAGNKHSGLTVRVMREADVAESVFFLDIQPWCKRIEHRVSIRNSTHHVCLSLTDDLR